MSRNIVLLTVDSLRADHCGFMDFEGDTTPTLDGLAEDGTVYRRAWSPGPRTPSSMPTVLTGKPLPEFTGEFNWRNRWDRISRHFTRFRTVGERLQDRGYTTVGLTTNPWTHGTGFDTGFDHFVELTADDMHRPSPAFRLLDGAMDLGNVTQRYRWHNKREWFVNWKSQFENILETVELARENEPYFLWVFLLDSHQPYIVPRSQREESNLIDVYLGAFQEFRHNGESLPLRTERRLRRAYRDSIRSTDTFVDRLQTTLSGDDHVLVFHSDHGEAFGEHGSYGHGDELWEENLHVPLLVHGLGEAATVSDPTSLRTIPSLLTDVADGTFDPDYYASDAVHAVTERSTKRAIRTDRWKYVDGPERRLYDLESDAGERTNLASDNAENVQDYHALLEHELEDARERSRIHLAASDVCNVGLEEGSV